MEELNQKLQNLGLTEDGKLPEIAITIDDSNVGEGKYISNIEVDNVDKTKLTLITNDIGLDKYVDKESVVLTTNNVLSWDEEKEIAQIGDKTLKIALPSKPGIKVSVDNVDKTDGTYVLVGVNESNTDTNELVFSKREFDIDSTLTNKNITPRKNVLEWGKSVNVATIGDQDIAVQLPEDIIVIENAFEKSNTQVVTNITIDDNDPTKLKVNYEDLIPKNIVNEETLNNTLKAYLTANDVFIDEEETQDVKFVTSITSSKNEDNDLILTLEKENITNVIDNIISVESDTPVLEWDKETAVAKIGNKEIKVKMPSQPDKADGNTRYKLSGGVDGGEFKITLSEIGENEEDGGSATINFSTDIPEKEINVIDEGEGKYVTSISTDVNDKHSIIVSREDIDLSGYLKENALDAYATQEWVNGKGFITSIPNEYVTESEINAYNFVKETTLEGYAQQSWVTEKITEAVTSGTVDLSEYATIQYVDEKFVKTEALNAYATQEWVNEQKYLTSIPDEYVTESDIDTYNFVKEEILNNYVSKNDIPSIVITGDTDGNTVSNIEVIDGGHTLKLTKTNISLKESDLVINESGEGEVITDITNNGHNITITKGNIEHPKATVSNKAITLTAKEGLQTIAEIDGTAITIQLDPNLTVNGDIPTIKTYVLTGNTQGKKTTIKLLDETNNESGSHSIDLSDFSTTSEINNLLTNKNYATQEWVNEQSYATENFVTSQNFLKSNALDAYATQEWVNGKGFITSIPDEYATQNWVTDTALNNYVKNSDITDKYADKKHEHNSSDIKDSIQSKDSIKNDSSELVQGKAIYGFIEDKLSNYIKKGEETQYVLPTANKDILGGIKVGYQNDGNNRNYAVNIDQNGNAFVNVPWEEVKNYLPNDEEVPVDLHYTPITVKDAYTAAEGKYISGIKYDKKHHIVDINEKDLPSEVNQAKSLSVGNVGSDTNPVKFVEGKPVAVTYPFLTGITSSDVTDALGYTPLSAETKYNGSTFIKVDSNTISANTGDTAETLAVGNHTHEGVYQPIGEYVENSDLGTLTFDSGKFESTSFKANENCTVKVPTHTSHITNDSNFITSEDISLSIEAKEGLTGGGQVSNNGAINISHSTINVSETTNDKTLKHGDTFNVVIPSVNVYGHVSGLTTTKYTLPTATLDEIGAAPKTHTHTKEEITNFTHNHTKTEITDFAHSHTKEDITDFAHRHNISEIDEIDNKIASYLAANDAMIFKGTITSENSFPKTFEAGWTYKVATAGTYFEQKFEVGDMVIAVKDATTSTTTTSSNFTTYWAAVQTNTDGIVIGPEKSVSGNIPVFDGTSGKLIKDSGLTIKTSVPENALFTDTNNYLTGVSGNANGEVTFTREGLDEPITWDASHTHDIYPEIDDKGYISVNGIYADTLSDYTFSDGESIEGRLLSYALKSDLPGVFTGATATADGKAGLVKAPVKGEQNSFLKGDGTWGTPTNTVNTAGAYNSNDKLYLIGASGQTSIATAGIVTNSNSVVYMQDGTLYADEIHVSKITMTSEANGFQISDGNNLGNRLEMAAGQAGSTNSDGKLYLIGASVQTAQCDTNSNSSVYMQNGVLTTAGLSVMGDINVTGTVSGATAYYQSSDERLKDFGEDIDVDFDKLKEIPKKYFTWKSDDTKKVDLGTSAQKVRELYPELVGGDDDTTLSVDYAKLSIIALKAVDKLHEENEMLKAELDMIKKHLGL